MDTLTVVTDEHAALAAELAAEGVEYALGAWIDVLGRARSKVVPIGHLPSLLAGSERYTPRGIDGLGQMNSCEPECIAVPDASTAVVLPWDRRFVFFNADLNYGGTAQYALCPRTILKNQLEVAAAAGYTFNLGVETEFYALQPQANPVRPVPAARSGLLRPTPAYDIEASLDAMPFLGRMVSCMQQAGFGVFSFDQEGGEGQYEFDFEYAPALQMADRLSLFRLMVRQVAKEFGLFATFMPKPFTGVWGSGHHFNMSLADVETGANLFRDEAGWTKIARGFVAGILRHAPALAAVATPTVNSYKRLSPRLGDGAISWAPVYAAYGDNNRSCMLRLPGNRPAVENRAVDAAANTYLTAAFMLAAGLEGIAEGWDPGEPVVTEAFDWTPGTAAAPRLPRTLLEAIEAFAADPLIATVFPAEFVSEYVAMKHDEWDDYHSQVTDWERDRYLYDL